MSEQTPEIDTIQKRLTRLEQENSRLKKIGVTVLLAIAAMLTTAMAQSWSGRYVEATRFVLKDSSGRIRGQWAAQEDSSGLSLYDEQERPVMELLSAPGQHATKLSLMSPKGAVSLWATTDEVGLITKESNAYSASDRVFVGLQGTPPFSALRLNDTGGGTKVNFLADSGGGVGMVMDEKGNPIWAAFKPHDSK